ncbi:DUF3109 family protein [Aureibaculum flavum]|nr:DUF3109 family protein [Aureibaculum flavum]
MNEMLRDKYIKQALIRKFDEDWYDAFKKIAEKMKR